MKTEYYFNVKPTKQEEEAITVFTKIISDYWNQNRLEKRDLSKTFTCKVLFDLAESEPKLNFITRGWFKFGAIINYPLINSKINNKSKFYALQEKLIKLCEEYDCNKDLYDWQLKQYQKFNNLLYGAMLNLKISLESKTPNEKIIRAALSDFYLNLNDSNGYSQVNRLLDKYISMSEQVLLSSKDVASDTKKLLEIFANVWGCFANFNYSKTVKGKNQKLVKQKAFSVYTSTITSCKTELEEFLSENVRPSEQIILKVSTPLQKELISGLRAFR